MDLHNGHKSSYVFISLSFFYVTKEISYLKRNAGNPRIKNLRFSKFKIYLIRGEKLIMIEQKVNNLDLGDFSRVWKMTFDSMIAGTQIYSTVFLIILYIPSFLLEIRVIIKISKSPWYPLICD